MIQRPNSIGNTRSRSRLVLFFQLCFLVIWLCYLFYPMLSSILEIAWIQLARSLTFLDWTAFILFYPTNSEFGIDYVVIGLIGLYVLCFLVYCILHHKVWPRSLQKQRLILIVVLPLLWLMVLPVGSTYYVRLRNSYELGGYLYLAYAGGAEQVRKDASALLYSDIEGKVRQADIPDTLARFYSPVVVDQEQELVRVYLGSRCGMCGSWQYLIFDDRGGTWMPDFINPSDASTYRLSEGIYLIHR